MFSCSSAVNLGVYNYRVTVLPCNDSKVRRGESFCYDSKQCSGSVTTRNSGATVTTTGMRGESMVMSLVNNQTMLCVMSLVMCK